AVHLDLGAHTAELIHIAVAVVPHALGNDAGAGRHAEDGGDLGLHIGGEARIGQGFHIGAGEGAGAAHQHGVVPLLDLHAHLQQLGGDALQVLGDDVLDEDLAAGGGHGGHVGARLNLIGDDGI